MNLNEINENNRKKLETLTEILIICTGLAKENEKQDRLDKSFYNYIMKLLMLKIGELVGGEVKLITQFRNEFESKSKAIFKSKLSELEKDLGLDSLLESDGDNLDG